MKLSDTFLPTAGVVGLLPMITYFILLVAMYAFLANFLLVVLTRENIRPEHRLTYSLTAIISAIAGISYFLIQGYYHDMLTELATLTDPENLQVLTREAYSAVGQYRYMDWAVTTPLLLSQLVSMLRVSFVTIRRSLAVLLLADLFMILAGYIGEQQLGFDNEILVGPKLLWGVVATAGYILVLLTLHRLRKQFAQQLPAKTQRATQLMARIIGIGWSIYPVGYFLTTTALEPSWIHIAFSLADMVTKIAVGLTIYWAIRQAPDGNGA